jgi:hypothetical protein
MQAGGPKQDIHTLSPTKCGIDRLHWLARNEPELLSWLLLQRRAPPISVVFVHVLTFGLDAFWVCTEEITLGTLAAFEATFLSMGYAMTYVTQYVPMLAQAAGSNVWQLLARSCATPPSCCSMRRPAPWTMPPRQH